MRTFLRTIFLLTNILVVILLLTSVIARYTNPTSTWIFEFISLGYPFYAIVNIVYCIFWMFSKKRYFALISVASLIISFGIFTDTFGFASQKPTTDSENEITLLSYNVNSFNYRGWKNRASVQAEIFNFLKETNADIVCLQEFHNDKKEEYQIMDSIRKTLGLRYSHIHKIHEIKDRYFYGNVIFSKYQIIHTGVLSYKNTGNSTVWADIVKENDTIRVYSNHLQSYKLKPEHIETIEQVKSGQEFEGNAIKKIVRKMAQGIRKRGEQTISLSNSIKECSYPTIICGDFNAPPYSFTYHAIQESADFNDAFLETNTGFGFTLNWNIFPQRLDYILVHPTYSVLTCSIEKLNLSDHFPLLTTFTKE